MFPETADWLEMKLKDVRNKAILNAGSNTWVHYHDDQWWIWEKVLKPLIGRGCMIDNVDTKEDLSLQIKTQTGMNHKVIDITKKPSYGLNWYDIVLCTSVIEHVDLPKRMLDVFRDVLRSGGVMWLEAPAVYPIHHDPIDNGLRLKNREECEEFLGKGWKIEEYAEVESERFPGDGTVGKGVIVKARPI